MFGIDIRLLAIGGLVLALVTVIAGGVVYVDHREDVARREGKDAAEAACAAEKAKIIGAWQAIVAKMTADYAEVRERERARQEAITRRAREEGAAAAAELRRQAETLKADLARIQAEQDADPTAALACGSLEGVRRYNRSIGQ